MPIFLNLMEVTVSADDHLVERDHAGFVAHHADISGASLAFQTDLDRLAGAQVPTNDSKASTAAHYRQTTATSPAVRSPSAASEPHPLCGRRARPTSSARWRPIRPAFGDASLLIRPIRPIMDIMQIDPHIDSIR
jgi:hypothetical protein